MSDSTQSKVLTGTMILVVTNVLVKLIGVIYKIPLTNLIGGYGMGFFNSAFEIYQVFLSLCTVGVPVAISKMVSESNALGRYTETRKILQTALRSFGLLGCFMAGIMFFGAKPLARMIQSDLTCYSIMALAPTVLCLSFTGPMRGFFQGFQKMTPTAITQFLEAVCKLLVGIALAAILLKMGYGAEFVSAGAIFGTTAGAILALLILIFLYNRPKGRALYGKAALQGGECRGTLQLLKDMLKLTIPIALSSLIVNLTGFLDLFFIMNRLVDIGYDQATATTVFGVYKSYAQTLFHLPPSIIASVNTSILPAMSAAFAVLNRERLTRLLNTGLKLVSVLAIPSCVGLLVFTEPILSLLFTDPAEIKMAVPLLQMLAIAVLWVSYSSMLSTGLQAVSKVRLPLISMLVGGVVKLVSNYILVGIPSINIMGASISTNLCYFTVFAMNLRFFLKYTETRVDWKDVLVKPLIASVFMAVSVLLSHRLFLLLPIPGRVATVLAIGVAAVVFFGVLILTGGLDEELLHKLPGGRRLKRFLKR